MALCLIYRSGFSRQLTAILVLAYANAAYQAINFGHLVSHRARTGRRPSCLGLLAAGGTSYPAVRRAPDALARADRVMKSRDHQDSK